MLTPSMLSIGCFSSAQMPLLPTTQTTGMLWRTMVSNSIAEKPNAPSPDRSITRWSGCASLAAMAYPGPEPSAPNGPGSIHRPGRARSMGRPAGALNEQRVAGRQHAACHAVDGQRQMGRLDQGFELGLGVGPPHRAARDHRGALRLPNQTSGELDQVRIRRGAEVGGEVLGGFRPRGP